MARELVAFRLDGTRLRSGSFDMDVPVGEWTTYDREGQPYKVTRLGTDLDRRAER